MFEIYAQALKAGSCVAAAQDRFADRGRARERDNIVDISWPEDDKTVARRGARQLTRNEAANPAITS